MTTATTIPLPFQLLDIEPLDNRLLVAPLAVPEKEIGRLLLTPGVARDRPQTGIVLKVGPGNWAPHLEEFDTGDHRPVMRQPLLVNPGDCVFYGKYSGQELSLAGRRVLLMKELEVFGLLREGTFTLVEHEDPALNHLAGEYCAVCTPASSADAEAALLSEREVVDDTLAKAALVEERERLRRQEEHERDAAGLGEDA